MSKNKQNNNENKESEKIIVMSPYGNQRVKPENETEGPLKLSDNERVNDLHEVMLTIYTCVMTAYQMLHDPELYSGISREDLEMVLSTVPVVDDLCDCLEIFPDDDDDDDNDFYDDDDPDYNY